MTCCTAGTTTESTTVKNTQLNKKLSCRWQTARRLCTLMLISHWYTGCLLVNDCDLLAGFSDFLPTLLPSDALNEGDPLELSGSYLVLANWNGCATIWWRSHDDRLSHLDYIQSVAVSNCRRLRSSSSSQLVIRHTRLSTIGDRAFPAAGCRLWNSLPPDVTSASTLSVFRNRLKTYLFSRSFPS